MFQQCLCPSDLLSKGAWLASCSGRCSSWGVRILRAYFLQLPVTLQEKRYSFFKINVTLEIFL